jgi:hypothetical protein
MHLHVGNGGHEDATQQVKESFHHISYYASLLQSRMYSTCAAIWHHRNSFQQTQIMGNTDVCRSSALEVQPLYSDTRWHVKHHIWYNKSLDCDPISYLLLNPNFDNHVFMWRPCGNLFLNRMTKNGQCCACVNLQLLYGILRLQIPWVDTLILWATNYVLSICHWKSHKNTVLAVCMACVYLQKLACCIIP